MEDSESRSYTQSVSRALMLLMRLGDAAEGLQLSELAKRVGLPASTAHRLLTTLQRDQFVRFEGGLWFVGVQCFNVGTSYLRARDLCHMASPYLQILMQETGETSNLALVENNELVYLAQKECPEVMRALARPGDQAPLTCSAVGKAILAFLPKQQAEDMITKSGIIRMTRKSHITDASLWVDLEQIKMRVVAFDDEEHSDGLRCVAAPLFGHRDQVIGALSVSGPSVRVSKKKLIAYGEVVQRVAKDMTKILGGNWPNSELNSGPISEHVSAS